MSTTKGTAQIISQELALNVYLQTLLDDIPEDFPAEEPVLVPVVAPVVVESIVVKVAPVPIAQTEVVVKSKSVLDAPALKPVLHLDMLPLTGKELQPIKVTPKAETIVPVVERKVAAPAPETQKIRPLSVMPDWSRNEFQALFFRVDHLILATPLTELSRTLMFTRKPTKLPNQPTWFLGLLPDQGKNVGILDTGQLIFGRLRGQRDLVMRPFPCLLITGDGNWGLACDEILSVGKLSPEKVRWRTLRQKRPWLIGTVTEELTAVIDIGELVPRRKSR